MLCTICKSPITAKRIEAAVAAKEQRIDIFNKFAPVLGYTGTPNAFYVLLHRHWKHRRRNIINIQGQQFGLIELVNRVTKIYGEKLDTLTPEELMREIKLKDVLLGQRVLLEARKVKMQEDNMLLAMAKLFGPQDVIEGELAGGENQNDGNGFQPAPELQPANTQ